MLLGEFCVQETVYGLYSPNFFYQTTVMNETDCQSLCEKFACDAVTTIYDDLNAVYYCSLYHKEDLDFVKFPQSILHTTVCQTGNDLQCFVKPTCSERDIVVTMTICVCAYMRTSVHACVQGKGHT